MSLRDGRTKEATYKITRFRMLGDNVVVKRGLTKDEAVAHCNDPESSSRTCSLKQKRIVGHDQWFDGFDQE